MLPSPKQHQQQAPLHQHQQTPPPHLQQGLSDEGGRHRPMPHDLKVNIGITLLFCDLLKILIYYIRKK